MNPIKQKPSILDMTLTGLQTFFKDRGLPAYRAKQVMHWLYMQQADSFDEMTNLNKELRQTLADEFTLQRLEVAREQVSLQDGSRKFLFNLSDGEQIESVLIPEKDHHTLCISTQVGCAQNCLFCLTAKGGLKRNLTSGEIVSQVRDAMHLVAQEGGDKPLSNVVFMGMGEPLENYDNVVNAINIMVDNEWGLRLAARRLTVSTAGVAPRLYDLCRDTKVKLAVSLNAADDKTRSKLMPINKVYPLDVLIKACKDFELPKGKRITFEYILMKGINDAPEDAASLAQLLRGVKAKINLIPFNEHDGVAFKRPDDEAVRAFADLLCDKYKYTAIVRYSKGLDISAACGQLRVEAQGASTAKN